MRGTGRVLVLLLALAFVVAIALCAIIVAAGLLPPCHTLWHNLTGPQRYDGHTIQCFAGDVVKVVS